MAPQDDETPILGTKHKLPHDFPYIRAWTVLLVGITLYMATALATIPLISQYVVSTLIGHNISNITSDNISLACGGTVGGSLDLSIQKQAADLTLYYSLIADGSAIFINIFVGPLSDSVGRRLIFILPFVGILLKSTFICLIVKLNLDLNWMYVAYGIDGMCGTKYAMFVALFGYTADVTVSGSKRTIAIAIVEGSLALSGSIGQLITGYLIDSTGYFYASLMCVICSLLGLFIMFAFLPETVRNKKTTNISPINNLRMVFGFYFTEGTRHTRCVHCVLMGTIFFAVITFLGRSSLETIYQLGKPFCWDSIQIGIYAALRITAQFMCTIIAMKVLLLCVQDAVVAIVSIISAIGGFILEALATNNTMMYMVPVVGVISVAPVSISRSLMSQMTPANKQGAMFASVAIVETICSLASNTLYNTVYETTVDYYQGAVWFMMAGFCVVNIIFFLLYICLIKERYPESESSKEVKDSVRPQDYRTFNGTVTNTHV